MTTKGNPSMDHKKGTTILIQLRTPKGSRDPKWDLNCEPQAGFPMGTPISERIQGPNPGAIPPIEALYPQFWYSSPIQVLYPQLGCHTLKWGTFQILYAHWGCHTLDRCCTPIEVQHTFCLRQLKTWLLRVNIKLN